VPLCPPPSPQPLAVGGSPPTPWCPCRGTHEMATSQVSPSPPRLPVCPTFPSSGIAPGGMPRASSRGINVYEQSHGRMGGGTPDHPPPYPKWGVGGVRPLPPPFLQGGGVRGESKVSVGPDPSLRSRRHRCCPAGAVGPVGRASPPSGGMAPDTIAPGRAIRRRAHPARSPGDAGCRFLASPIFPLFGNFHRVG